MSHFPFRKKDGVLHVLLLFVIATLVAPLTVGTAPIGLNYTTVLKGCFLLGAVMGTIILIAEFWKMTPNNIGERLLIVGVWTFTGSCWCALLAYWFHKPWPGYVISLFLGVPLTIILCLYVRDQVRAFWTLHRKNNRAQHR